MIIKILDDNEEVIFETQTVFSGLSSEMYSRIKLENGNEILHNNNRGMIDLAVRVLKIFNKGIKK